MAGPGSGGGGLVSGEPEAGAPPARANALQRLRARLAARPDTEHEQGILRLIISSLVFLYLLPDALTKHNTLPLYVMGIHLVLALAIFLRIAYSTNVSPARRVFAQFADVAAITWYMTVFGESAAPLFLLYIWVTLGSGFRFGPRYLVSELAMSVGGFGIALYFNDFWRGHTALGVGLLLGMFAVSLYVLSLVRRMFDALARAEAANLAKRRFISMVSHELRTPLNAIIGFSDMLINEERMRLDGPRRQEYAKLINDSGNHLLTVVNGILDMSKLETGDFEIAPEPFAPAQVIATCCDLLALKARETGIELSNRLPDSLPDIIADKRSFKQILLNLISNAVKFTERGGKVTVSAAIETACIVLTVEDTGVGISAEDLKKIGRPFFQARGTYDRRHDGTGLGLSIVRGLIDLHGGGFEVVSEVGKGTRCTVRLPWNCETARPLAKPAAPSNIERPSFERAAGAPEKSMKKTA